MQGICRESLNIDKQTKLQANPEVTKATSLYFGLLFAYPV